MRIWHLPEQTAADWDERKERLNVAQTSGGKIEIGVTIGYAIVVEKTFSRYRSNSHDIGIDCTL